MKDGYLLGVSHNRLFEEFIAIRNFHSLPTRAYNVLGNYINISVSGWTWALVLVAEKHVRGSLTSPPFLLSLTTAEKGSATHQA